MKHLIVVTVLALLASPALAQEASNPIVDHFRAYRAAQDRGDLAGAEREAAAALAASVARDGEGGRTGVLAINLAQARIDLGHDRDAVEPARRAQAIAAARGEASGVSGVLAELLVRRGELVEGDDGSAARLQSALEAAAQDPDLGDQTFEAAGRLAAWQLRERNYDASIADWDIAIAAMQGDEAAARMSRAQAYIGRATTLAAADRVRARYRTGTHITIGPQEAAVEDYAQAIRTVEPLTRERAPNDALTQPQLVYSQALAWRNLLHARMDAMGWEDLDREAYFNGLLYPRGDSPAPSCPMHLIDEPEPRWPMSQSIQGHLAAMTLRFVTNEAGETEEASVVAVAGDQDFRDAVERVISRWRLVPTDAAPAVCNKAAVHFIQYLFTAD